MVKTPESEVSDRSFNPDLGFAELTREPVKALVKSVALHCAGCLNVPLGKKQVSFFLSRKNWRNFRHFTLRFLRFWSPNLSVSSEAVIALGKSCLLANTNSVASRSSSSCNCEPDLYIFELFFQAHHFLEFLLGLRDPLPVIAVHYKDQPLSSMLSIVSQYRSTPVEYDINFEPEQINPLQV